MMEITSPMLARMDLQEPFGISQKGPTAQPHMVEGLGFGFRV